MLARVVLLLVASAIAITVATASDIVVIRNEEEFRQVEQGLWIADFYAPWCGFCKQLAPVLETTATKLKERSVPVSIATINCEEEGNKPLCRAKGIRGFPTVLLMAAGQSTGEFQGMRTEEGLLAAAAELVTQHPSPPPVEEIEARETTEDEQSNDANPAVGNTDGEVVILTSVNFDQLTQSGPWMLEFFAPWCGHCKKLAPTWKKLAESTRGKLSVGSIDCTVETALCSRFNVRGYPTLKFSMDKGVIQDYKQGRSFEAVSEFAKRLTSPVLGTATATELESITTTKAVAVFFLAEDESFRSRAQAVAAPVAIRVPCFYSVDKQLHQDLKVTSLPAIVIMREGELLRYPGSLTNTEGMVAWINDNRIPLLVEFESASAPELLDGSKKLLLLIVDPSDPATDLRFKPEVRDAFKAYLREASSEPMNAAWLNGIFWSNYASKTFSLPKLPMLIIADPANELFYATAADGQYIEIEKSAVSKALRDLQASQLKSSYMGGVMAYSARMLSKRMGSLADIITGNPWQSVAIIVVAMVVMVYWAFNASRQSPRPGTAGGTAAVDTKKAA